MIPQENISPQVNLRPTQRSHMIYELDSQSEKITEMEHEDREKAVTSLVAWIEKEKLYTVKTFPTKFTVDFERVISHAEAIFLVSRSVAQDLTEAAFGLAHERYLKMGLTL